MLAAPAPPTLTLPRSRGTQGLAVASGEASFAESKGGGDISDAYLTSPFPLAGEGRGGGYGSVLTSGP
jgi:hypothetical protein